VQVLWYQAKHVLAKGGLLEWEREGMVLERERMVVGFEGGELVYGKMSKGLMAMGRLVVES
jgi:hypothetical protein